MSHERENSLTTRKTPHSPGAMLALVIAPTAVLFAVLMCGPAASAQFFSSWTPAVPVDHGNDTINSAALEGCPIESPDGLTLFFASNRPAPEGLGGINIWLAQRDSEQDLWGAPEVLPAPVNSGVDDFCPTALPGNRLMFVSRRASDCGPQGPSNIYQTRLHPVHGWLEPQLLPCGAASAVNSFGDEFSPALVEADGQGILFFSSDREGSQNIYMSTLQASGSWGPAIAVDELNTAFHDARPNVRKDGLEIVFDSTRGGGPPSIYSASRSSLADPWSNPEPLGPAVNSAASETRASFSRDGTRLYFGSTRNHTAENPRSSDIFVSTRPGPGQH